MQLTKLVIPLVLQLQIGKMLKLSWLDLDFWIVIVRQQRFPCNYVPSPNIQQLRIRLWSSAPSTNRFNLTLFEPKLENYQKLTLMSAHHHPQASRSFDRENTSTSIPSVKTGVTTGSSGGNRTWLNKNFDSFCQLKTLKIIKKIWVPLYPSIDIRSGHWYYAQHVSPYTNSLFPQFLLTMKRNENNEVLTHFQMLP